MSSDRISQEKYGSVPGLDLLERSPWSVLSLEALLVSMVRTTAPGSGEPAGHVDVCGPCCYYMCGTVVLLQPRAILMSEACAAT